MIFLVEFFKCWKYPSNSSETFKILFFHQNNQFEAKTACFAGLFNFNQNRCIRTLPALAIFLVDFLGWVFQMLKIPFEFFLKHSKFCSFIKTISLRQKKHVLRTFQFWPISLYPDLTGVAILSVDFFGWVFQMLKMPFEFFWNIQNFVLSSKHISLKKKHHVLRTFQFWLKLLYMDLPGVAIFLVDFLKCWKGPSNSSETFKMLFFLQNNQFEAKRACFADFSTLTKIAVSRPYRRGHFFGWFFEMWKIPFDFFWNIQNFVLSSKQPVWSKNSMFCGLFNFDQNRCTRTLWAWPICWLIFLVEFFKCWKYSSDSSQTFKILFFHQKQQHVLRTF